MTFDPGRLESILARLAALPDARARDAARDALTSVLDMHREAIERLARRLREAGPDGDRLFRVAAEDELVAGMLLLHGLHPLPRSARVERAIERVRASNDRERGRIEITSLDDEVIRIHVSGSERLRRAVERAASEAAPEVERVEVIRAAEDLVPAERLVRRRPRSHERCDLCGGLLAERHDHMFDGERRKLTCACDACSVLLDGAAMKLRRVRRKGRRLEDLQIRESQWEALKVPVGLAFFSRSSALGGVVASYPGPVGAVESEVTPSAWNDLVADNAVLADLEPDVEALVVDRLTAPPRYYVLSIDECYRLTGLVRSRWQGIAGGSGPPRAVAEFFADLTEASP